MNLKNPLTILFHQFKPKKWSLCILLLFILLSQLNIGFSQSIPSYVPKNGLVGWWPFNGNANDESGNGNNGSVNGATLTTDRFGNANKAYDFNGSSFIKVLHNNMFNFGVNDYTLSAWAMRKGGDFLQNIISKELGYPTFKGWSLNFINNYPRFEPGTTFNSSWYSNGNINNIGGPYTNSISNDVWYHLVAVFNPTNSLVKLYINGTLAITRPISGSLINPDNLNDLFFGVYQNDGAPSGPEFLTGKIDDIGIYNRALTDGEILTLFNGNCVISNFNSLQDTTKACGVSSTLNAGSGFTSYSWSTGATSQTIAPTTSGKYKITVTNASGCTASDSTYLSIVNANILNNDTTICKGNSLQLTSELNNLSRSSNIYNPGTPNPWSYPSPADGGYIPLGTFGAPSVFSISCYINPSDIQASIAIILDCNHGGSSNWVIQNYPNISSGSNWSFGSLQFSLTPNTWQHLLITYNNGQKKAYVNGVLQASSFETINWSGNPKLFLGNWPEGARRFHGGIDELYITYDIQQTANFTPLSSITTPSTNLFGLWHFDEGIGTTTANNGGQLFSTNNWIWQNLNPSNAINYQWSTGETTNSINVTPSKTTKYYCTVSNGISNCMDSVTVTVVLVDTSLIVLDPPKICTNGGSVRMQAGVASTYKWLKNGVVIPSATSSLYSALQTGIYRVVVTNSVGCSDTSRAVDVTLYPLPSGTVKTPASNNICSGSSLLLTVTGGDSYQWQLNGSNISGANSATYEASVPGEYTATLISSASCSAPATGSITLSLLSKPTAAFTYQNNCVNVPVLFSNASNRSQSGAVTYVWSFGNGAFSSQFTPSDQLYTTVGNYIAKLVIVSTACPLLSDTISKIIKIVAPENGTRYPAINVIKNVPYLLQARDIGVSYSWLPLSGISDPHISNPSYNYSVGADYRINITNAAGCTTVDSLLIRAFDKTGVYVPKAFAPNGNGNNDLLRPILVRITTINYFRVYNRWGQLIYQTKNIGEGWNGTFKGATQPIETYTWIFEGVDYNGIIIRETGKTTLLR